MPITLHNDVQVPAAEQPPSAPKPNGGTPARPLLHVTDARGRVIAWQKLNALENFDLTEIAGAGNASNTDWMIQATIAFGTRSIDDDPVPRPTTKNQIRAIIARLEDDGMEAVLGLFREQVDQDLANDGGIDRAKNSQGTPPSSA